MSCNRLLSQFPTEHGTDFGCRIRVHHAIMFAVDFVYLDATSDTSSPGFCLQLCIA
jgi:hypothetical protein